MYFCFLFHNQRSLPWHLAPPTSSAAPQNEYEIKARRMETSNSNNYENISAVGCGTTLLGTEDFSAQEVIEKLDKGDTFFTLKNGKKAYAKVVRPHEENPYIRMHPDDEEDNN